MGALGRQAHELELVARAGDDVERLGADGAGRAEDQEAFHPAIHDGRGRVTLRSAHGTIHVWPRRPIAELVAAARAGDRAAFGTLVERHQAALLRTCRRALGDPGGRRRGRAGGGAAGAHRPPRPARRRRLRPVAVRHRPQPRPPRPAHARAAPARGGCRSPRRPAPRSARTARACSPRSPPCRRGQRDAVALFYLADLSHAQISARLGISAGAVKTRLHKARASLQTRLADLRRELPAMPSTVPMHVADIRDTGGDDRSPATSCSSRRTTARAACRSGSARAEATTLAARLHAVDLPAARHLPLRRRPPGRGRRAPARGPRRPPRRDGLLRPGRARGRRVGRRAAERRDQPRARDGRAGARRGGGARPGRRDEREIGEELAAALASPRDARAIADELKARMTPRARRMSGRPNHSPRITSPHEHGVDPHPRAVEQQVGDQQERGADRDREEAEAGDQQRVGRLDQPLAVALVEAQPVRGRRRDQARRSTATWRAA